MPTKPTMPAKRALRRRVSTLVAFLMLLTAVPLLASPSASAQESRQTLGHIRGTILDTDNQPFRAFQADLFHAQPDGTRGPYIKSVGPSDRSGNYDFGPTVEGCYVVVLVLDDPFRWEQTDSKWDERSFCMRLGTIIDARAYWADNWGTFTGTNEHGVVVDLFAAGARGERGRYIRSSDVTGGEFTLEAAPGCFILTFIAPAGRTWADTGTLWTNQGRCIRPHEEQQVEPQLNPA